VKYWDILGFGASWGASIWDKEPTMTKRRGIPGLSFSWKRALGVSAAKGRLSRAIGVPLTKQGRQRKYGRMMGCATWPIVVCLLTILFAVVIFALGIAAQ
jgi:hypothetical protein